MAMGITYSLENDYTDFGWTPLSGSGIVTLNDPRIQAAADLLHLVGVKNYKQHVKSHAFIRTPWCETDVTATPINSPGYFNHILFAEPCFTSFQSGLPISNFLTDIVQAAHQNEQHLSAYWQAYSDYAFEIQRPTQFQPLANPGDFLISPSPCLCKTLNGSTSGGFFSGNAIVTPSVYNIDDDDDDEFDDVYFSDGGNDEVANSAPWNGHHDHYLCMNCIEWLSQLEYRIAILASHGIDALYFDISQMPAQGCFCLNCREAYAASPFCPPNVNCIGNYVGGIDPLIWSNYEHRRRLADFMDFTQVTRFEHFNKILHDFSPLPTKAVSVVSVSDLASLNKDDYRTAFAAIVDIPKLEYYTPIKNTNNRIFWGSTYTPAPTCPCNNQILCTDAQCLKSDGSPCNDEPNCDPNHYFSILHNYRIPEEIRLAGALSVVRDASKHGLILSWTSYEWAENESNNNNGNHSLQNNRMIKTMLGWSYVMGTVFTTSQNGSFFTKDPDDGLYKLNERFFWDFSDKCVAPNVMPNTFNSQNSQITPVFDLDTKYGSWLANKRPYRWVGVLFSERERNDYLYATTPPADNTLPGTQLPGGGLVHSSNGDARREALAWLNHLLPMYGAYNALHNAINTDPNSPWFKQSLKLPVVFLNDNQIADSDTEGYQAIIVPSPDEVADPGNTFDFLDALNDQTESDLNHLQEVQNGNTLLIPARRNLSWFNNTAPTQHQQLLHNLRENVIGSLTLPEVFVTGHSAAAHTVQAGFYVDEATSEMVIPLVINPIWGLPRAENLPNATYSEIPEVASGDIKVHIRVGSDFAPTMLHPISVRVGFSDLNTPDYIENITIYQVSSSGEFVIDIPSFKQFAMVRIYRKKK